MTVGGLLRSRLALRIYLTGLAQVAVVAAGFFAILFVNRPSRLRPPSELASLVGARLEPVIGDVGATRREMEKLHTELSIDVAVVASDDRAYASTPEAGALRCPARPSELAYPEAQEPPWGPGSPCASSPIDLPNGTGTVHVLARAANGPPSLAPRVVPLVLLVVGVSSLLLAWSLVRPLRRMSQAARALGDGDLSARVNIHEKSELGDVARAFDDMAERVSMLLRAERELLANVSHELRTPLARIRVALDLATEGDTTVAHEAMKDIAADLDELERLLSDVLTAAKLDLATGPASTGLPPLRLELLEPNAVLEAAAQRMRKERPARQMDLETTPDLPTIHADPVLLRRLFDNLLANADKYTENADSPIMLRASTTKGALVVDVVDDGVGISAADLPLIFRPFFRADRSRTRSTGGLGLGLTLAKRIVEAHSGTIEIHSELGHGTRVRVTIPGSDGALHAAPGPAGVGVNKR